MGLYGTVKSALRVMTDVMRVELQGAGIRVVLVEPVGANILAFIVFRDVPRLLEIVGGVLILGGIGVTFWRESVRGSVGGLPVVRERNPALDV